MFEKHLWWNNSDFNTSRENKCQVFVGRHILRVQSVGNELKWSLISKTFAKLALTSCHFTYSITLFLQNLYPCDFAEISEGH